MLDLQRFHRNHPAMPRASVKSLKANGYSNTVRSSCCFFCLLGFR